MSAVQRTLVLLDEAIALCRLRGEDVRDELARCPASLVVELRANLPVVAKPWRVTDMRDGETTKLVREDHEGNAVATIRRTGRKAFRWCAWDVWEVISPTDSERVDWPTLADAQTACDEALRERGVVMMEVE